MHPDPDPLSLTAAARDGSWRKYLAQIPDTITDPAERQRRAELLRQADMRVLARRSAEIRRQRRRLREQESAIAREKADLEALEPDADSA